MKIEKEAMAGTLESSDVLITVAPHDSLEIIIDSAVIRQFGEQIKVVVHQTLEKMNVTEGKVTLQDKGALDFVIQSRLETAVLRSCPDCNVAWEVKK